MSAPETETTSQKSGVSWSLLATAIGVMALFAVFAFMLLQPGRDTSAVPSALIGREAPETALPAVDGLRRADGELMPAFTSAVLDGRVSIVNVWASWCAPCREEHPHLMALADDERVQIVGLNYKDTPANAARFLGSLGNPFDAVGADQNGRTAINWGVYGVPETYLVGKDGTIVWKHVGPITPGIVEGEMLPLIAEHSATQ